MGWLDTVKIGMLEVYPVFDEAMGRMSLEVRGAWND